MANRPRRPSLRRSRRSRRRSRLRLAHMEGPQKNHRPRNLNQLRPVPLAIVSSKPELPSLRRTRRNPGAPYLDSEMCETVAERSCSSTEPKVWLGRRRRGPVSFLSHSSQPDRDESQAARQDCRNPAPIPPNCLSVPCSLFPFPSPSVNVNREQSTQIRGARCGLNC